MKTLRRESSRAPNSNIPSNLPTRLLVHFVFIPLPLQAVFYRQQLAESFPASESPDFESRFGNAEHGTYLRWFQPVKQARQNLTATGKPGTKPFNRFAHYSIELLALEFFGDAIPS